MVVENTRTVHDCKRFIPREEKSIFCRDCGGMWYNHTPRGRGFETVYEMHKAYSSNSDVITWLRKIGPVEQQIVIIRQILEAGEDVVGAPDNQTLKAVFGVLTALKVEREQKKQREAFAVGYCEFCREPLEVAEEKICFQCSVMATHGEAVPASEPKSLYPENDHNIDGMGQDDHRD